MWRSTVCCIIFVSLFTSGKPFSLKPCLPQFPEQTCGGASDPSCKSSYKCVSGKCCRSLTFSFPVRKCPFLTIYTGTCPNGDECTSGDCIKGSCCKKFSITVPKPICPLGTTSAGTCLGGSGCIGGRCVSGTCCRTPLVSKCPNNGLSSGTCAGGRTCREPYTCTDGVCCQGSGGISIPHFGRCPYQFILLCPPHKPPPDCAQDTDCPTGKKCCQVGCQPYQCHDPVDFRGNPLR